MAALAALAGCSEDAAGPSVRMDFAGSMGSGADLYAAPLPSDHRLNADGTVELTAFPNRDAQPVVSKILAVLDGRATGFGATSAVFFTTEAPVDEASLPDLFTSVNSDASVYLVGIDPESPAYLVRQPIDVRFVGDGGPYGAANMLVALPLQGHPLLPATRYAAVVTSAVRATAGAPLARSPALAELASGAAPAGLTGTGLESYRAATHALEAAGLLADAVALTAFTTGDAARGLSILSDHAHGLGAPEPVAPLTAAEVFDDFCVFESELDMPVYQTGEAPFTDEGGEIPLEDGPVVDHYERARIFVTVPRATMPADGWPTVVMIRTGGGGDRPLVDRGVRDVDGVPLEPGSGPARDFARAGYAGVSVDGPHGGIRNITNGDEQFLIFNVTNPYAMRDNVRQSALEVGLVPEILDTLTVDTSSCPDASATATFDTAHLALFGHSTGATIASPTLAANPRFGAVILSGSGGSWIENVVFKKSPLDVRPLADILVGYTGSEFSLNEHDPVLTMLQWAGEPADPPIYFRSVITGAAAPRHVLMLQGIVDTYILPPIANSASLSIGLDLAGDELDRDHPELAQFLPLADHFPLVGRERLSFPVEGNRDGTTAVVVQHEEDGVEDGHEIAFQKDEPKNQYRCFLQTWLTGTPRVIAPDGACD